MKEEVQVTLGYLTCQRVSDILDQLRKVDAKALSMARRSLPVAWARVISARANMKEHPTRPDLAKRLGLTVNEIRHAEIKGLLKLCEKFEFFSGHHVTVLMYRGQV